MRYERMRPDQLRVAIAAGTPVVLPIGVMEYHAGHLPAGTDLLAVTEVLARLEASDEVVILPPFAYGAASHAVIGPEGTGTLHVDATVLVPFAEALFRALLAAGFRNIHGVVHHQTENFIQGMPTDLAFKLAGRNAVFKHLEAELGTGWWGRRTMEDYYAQHAAGTNPFNWIRIHPSFPNGASFPYDHAGEGETSLMLALAPESVDLARLGDGGHWYTDSAVHGSAERGEEGIAICLAHLRSCLGLA